MTPWVGLSLMLEDDFRAAAMPLFHISGGSFLPAWGDPGYEAPVDEVRCDTHDDRVPGPVFDLLERALERFPNVRAVVLERLGGTIRSDEHAEQFRRDFHRVKWIVEAPRQRRDEVLDDASVADEALRERSAPETIDDAPLARFQSALLRLLEGAHVLGTSPATSSGQPALLEAVIRERLENDPAFAPYRDDVIAIDRRALGIAARIVKKWARRGTEFEDIRLT